MSKNDLDITSKTSLATLRKLKSRLSSAFLATVSFPAAKRRKLESAVISNFLN